ncbi:hypothetical protein FHS27_001306 [Rhodopirellula rubra]|uniref:Uncharacterized protein n=1 Tax=Aporhodopirellula rubra TaxID=980271 RepID=A0A7W5H563_9BACT|nr:hypothetical protein [Aporhodopirellula rubra]MBB3205506.1 hypothetical protein [Aporhodopirellula rubra]
MQIERRHGTTNQYAVRTQRINGKATKRYIGKVTDPAIQLFAENERLAAAEKLAYREECSREQENDRAAREILEWLCQWSSHWKVLRQLHEREMHSKPTAAPTPTTESDNKLPCLQEFNETCRLAEEGDADAQRQLDAWIAATPAILSEATDMIGTARDYLIQIVGSASAENSVLWQKKIDSDTSAILEDAGDDRLSQMYAEVTVLAWLDVMRSSIMPSLAGGDMNRASYWGTAMGRSQKRWSKISKAFRLHVKQSKKSQAEKKSAR